MSNLTDVRQLRLLRQRVRGTLGLTTGGENITEEPGSWWVADIKERKVRWTPFSPYAPYEQLNDDLLLYLTAHEASHLKWTGGYDVDGLKPDQAKRFHRFVNAVEDLRVDRQSERQYLGFGARKQMLRRKFRVPMLNNKPEGWSDLDQIAMNAIYSFDIDEPPFGTSEMQAKAAELWPTLSRIANVASTQDVADALLPIFRDIEGLNESEPEQGENESGEGEPEQGEPEQGESGEQSESGDQSESGEGESGEQKDSSQGEGSSDSDDSNDSGDESGLGGSGDDSGDDSDDGADADVDQPGADEPAEHPTKSQGGTPGSMAPGEELDGMADDADTESRRRLISSISQRAYKMDEAESIAVTQLGPADASDYGTDRDRYLKTEQRVRASSVALSNRLKSVLRHNAQDAKVGGQRRGSFDSRRAWKVQAGNPRVFRRKGTVGGHDYTVGLLVDNSGSMKEEMLATADATVMVAEALERAGLGVFVIIWNSNPRAMKRLNESLRDRRVQNNLGSELAARGGTVESRALILAHNEFEKAGRESRKLMITITDGQTKFLDEAKELLDELERTGVSTMAVRLTSSKTATFAKHYKHGVRVEHATELVRVLPQLINRVVKRGN